MPTATNPAPVLPPALAIGLKRVGAHLLRRRLALGAGNLMLAVSLTLILVFLVDFFLPIPLAPRWALWGTLVGGISTVLIRRILIPVIRRPRWIDLAAVAARAHPELGERLTAAVALRADETAGRAHGSPAMIAAMADRAADSLGAIDLAAALPGRPAWKRLAAGFVAAATVALLILAFPIPFASLAERVLMPWRDEPPMGRFVVTVRDGDRVIGLGDDVTITAEVRPRFGASPDTHNAELLWIGADGKTQRAPMVADPSTTRGTRTWRLTRPRVDASFTYRVASGSIESKRHQITAIERPSVARLTAKVAPPSYAHRPTAPAADPTRIEALHASNVTLTITASRPVRQAVLQWPEPAVTNENINTEPPRREFPAAPADRGGRSWTVTAPAIASGRFEVVLRDDHGIQSAPGPERYLAVSPDAAPRVAWTDSDAGLTDARADDYVPGGITASDDLAVASAELHYSVTRNGTEILPAAGQRPLPLNGMGTPKAQGELALDLRPLSLQPGDVVAYRVKVLDNRPPDLGGPGIGWTPERSVTITEKAAPLAQRRGEAERSAIREQLEAIQSLANANRQATEPLRYSADTARRDPNAWNPTQSRALRERETATREIADRLQSFALEIARQGPFAPLARPAQQVADVETAAAREALARAAQAIDPEPRFEALKEADAALGATITRIDELKHQLDELGKLNENRRRLAHLAHRQDALAARTREDARIDQAAAEQAALARELDQILKDSPQLRAETLAAQQQRADDLAEQTRALADRQREEARRTADPSLRADALHALATEQRAIEADARRLAVHVDEPLAQNGRGRLNTYLLAQTTAALERADLDAARRETEGAEAELRRLSRDIESVPEDPKALARRLLRRQGELKDRLHEVVRQTVADPGKITDLERDDLNAALAPLRERQQALAALAARVPIPKDRLDIRDQATAKQQAAIESLQEPESLRHVDQAQAAAYDALRKLADAVPDTITRRLPQRKLIDEARRRAGEVAREIERHLRETKPRPDQPFQSPHAATELAQRLVDTARKQAEIAADLASVEAGPRLEPQRQTAAVRAEALRDALAKPDREALPELALDAKAAADRLAQAAAGQTTADVVAAEIAEEMKKHLNAPNANLAGEVPRLRAALNALNLPDAEDARDQAIQSLERLDSSDAKPADRQAAMEAVDAVVAQLVEPPQPRVDASPDRDPEAEADPLAAPVPDDPALDLSPEHAQEALALARRQRALRERLQAILADRIPPQQALREASKQLAKIAEEIGQATGEASPRARDAAQQAQQLLDKDAPEVMDKAASQLGLGQADPARDTQRWAAETLERAADHAENLAAAIRADTPPESAQNPNNARLGHARTAQRDAAQRLAQAQQPGNNAAQAAQQAADAMQQAASDLRAAAEAGNALAQSEAEGQPGQQPTESPTPTPESSPAGTAEADLARLQQELRARTGRSWGELPGHLRTEILNQAQGRYRADYARLIQLYFREIAQAPTGNKATDANRPPP